jgi:hypothetical protein
MRKGIKDAIVQLRSNQLSVLYGARKKLLTYFEDAGLEERAEILDVLLTSDDSWHRREGLTLMMSVDACFYAEGYAEFFDDPDRLVRIDACRRVVFRRTEKRRSSHLAIQLAPRITEVSAEELRVFRNLVL